MTDDITSLFHAPFAEQVAFFRQKLGNLIPTARWTDVQRDEHDRGFMVAGAQNADMLASFAASIDRAIASGGTLEEFRKDFADQVERTGWDYTGEFNWRTRVIYTTNLSVSYNAGQLAQLREDEFPLWRYVHSDAVRDPRPEHLAWDGVTLPADHPWFKTHFTPNGWNCQCRIVGVTSLDDSAQYGRVISEAPDDGIDPKTGMPAGIDKGWDYMPGDTVSDTVRLMAAKMPSWPYNIAKAYMQGVPEGVRDRLAMAYRGLPSVADDARRYAQRALDNTGNVDVAPYSTLGLLTMDQAAKVTAETGIDATGFDYAISDSATRHISIRHGEGTEIDPRQRPVTSADYAMLPRILDAPDSVAYVGISRESKLHMMQYTKTIDGETFTAVFEVMKGRKMLSLKTFYIAKKG